MDGSKFGSFEKGAGDFVKAFATDTKKVVSDSATAAGQQTVGAVVPKQSEPTSNEGSLLEQNATGKPQGDTVAQQLQRANAYAGMARGQSASSADKGQKEIDEEKITYTRKLLHDQMYYKPTFQIKPRQVEQEREQQYQTRNQQEEQKKKMQELPMQEEKKRSFIPIGMNKKAKGEVGKAGS